MNTFDVAVEEVPCRGFDSNDVWRLQQNLLTHTTMDSINVERCHENLPTAVKLHVIQHLLADFSVASYLVDKIK
jgi:hypothetical protein